MFNNMGSGVFVNADCQNAFRQLSAGSLRYIIYKIEGKGIVIETAKSDDDIGVDTNDYENNSKEAYEAFVKDLKKRTNGYTDCRYAVFDFKFACNRPGAGTSKMDKIIFIQLCPDGASIKKKMVYASSASAIKSSLLLFSFVLFFLYFYKLFLLMHVMIKMFGVGPAFFNPGWCKIWAKVKRG